MKRTSLRILALLFAFLLCFTSCDFLKPSGGDAPAGNVSLDTIPAFSGKPYVEINGNVPFFTEEELKKTDCFEFYSDLDSLGRCGVVYAVCGKDTMPPKGDERGEIGHVKPSGWVQGKYDTSLVDGGFLYNRSHLLGWQLTDEDDNEKNLITGTRYFNVKGMLPFENMVADYIRETGGKVWYRVTPIYEGKNLVASGVLMEASSVGDGGGELSFCVYCYNVQPGVAIDYATGKNALDTGNPVFPEDDEKTEQTLPSDAVGDYVLNISSKRIHKPSCSSVDDMAEHNKKAYTGTRDALIAEGYRTCGVCFK